MPIPNDFQKWWDNYKHKIPGPKRTSVKRWALLGWNAHVDHLEQVALQEKQHLQNQVDEYNKAGRPAGWWGDPD